VSDTPATILAEAAAAAGSAPSIHNTQPWRWRVHPDALDLYADRSRQLGQADPFGRLLTVSCGAALHHARVSLAAEGWRATVTRLPEPADPDLLARLVLAERVEVTPEAMRTFQATEVRHTDRRPVSDEAIEPEKLATIEQAVAAEGARLHLLSPDQLLDLAAAAAQAQSVELADPSWRAELEYWAGGAHPTGTGVPEEAIPSSAPETTVPGRDFGHPGTLPVSAGHDRTAVYMILYSDEDTPVGWLRGGEALSAAWLTATQLGVSIVPLSAAVEVTGTRVALRQLLAGLGYPYLVLRLGVADAEHPGAPHPPRLPSQQVVEIVPD
jgi:nitroreductase